MKMILGLILFTASLSAEFYSQHGQDEYVFKEFFPEKKEGIFIDIGAHDGITFSNTYFFEKELNWTGICIEPLPHVFEKLKNLRKAICIQGCIANRKGTAKFLKVSGRCEMLSGLVDKFDPKHMKRIDKEVKKFGGEKQIIKVPLLLFNELMEKHQMKHVDFLSLDTEGGELEILKSIDFDTYEIDIITVENNYSSEEIKNFLASKNYQQMKKLGCDEVYRRLSFFRQ